MMKSFEILKWIDQKRDELIETMCRNEGFPIAGYAKHSYDTLGDLRMEMIKSMEIREKEKYYEGS